MNRPDEASQIFEAARVRARAADPAEAATAGRLDAPPEPTGTESWEEPVPLDSRATLPSFPLATLPLGIAAMARAAAEEVQVPVDLTGALAMGVLSTAASGRAQVVVRGQWREPLNLYLVTAMPPGSGKSPAFKLMFDPVFAAEREMQQDAARKRVTAETEHEKLIAAAEEARRAAKTDAEIKAADEALRLADARQPDPVMPRLTADDVSPEELATIMADQGGRLAILSAEGTFFSVIMGRYTSGKPNVELVLKGHAGDRHHVNRRGRDELIERASITICATVQPTVLREVAAKAAVVDRGVLARFLISLPPDLVGSRNITPELLAEHVLRDYADDVKRLVTDLAGWTDPAMIRLTPGAAKLHTEYRAEIEPRLRRGTGDLETLRDWASKLAGATARIAGLLHLAENGAALDPGGLFAKRWVRYSIRLAPMAMILSAAVLSPVPAAEWVSHVHAARRLAGAGSADRRGDRGHVRFPEDGAAAGGGGP